MKNYKVKGIEVDNDISHSDLADEMTKILSEELAKSIDKQIIENIQRLGKTIERQEKIRRIFYK